jgi:hypothetical protein
VFAILFPTHNFSYIRTPIFYTLESGRLQVHFFFIMETDDNTKNCTEMFIHMKQAGYKEAATAFSPNCEEVHLQDQRFTVGPVVI